MNYKITFHIKNAIKVTCKHLQYQKFFWVLYPEPHGKEEGKGDGEGSEEGGERRGEKRMEFVVCSRKKKEKPAPAASCLHSLTNRFHIW
jgi:hypothetical protein